jgi:hypothetical protein
MKRRNILLRRVFFISVLLSVILKQMVFSQENIKNILRDSNSIDTIRVEEKKKEALIKDPNHTRTFLLPTATTPKKLEGYIGDFAFLFLTGAISITDNIMLNAGYFLLPITSESVFLNYGLKINFYDDQKTIATGAGVQMLHVTGSDNPPGMFYAVTTVGNDENKFNLLAGMTFNLKSLGNSESSMIIGLGGSVHLVRELNFMTELYYVHEWDLIPMIAGVRFYGKHWSGDIGFVLPLNTGDGHSSFRAFPIFSVFYCF